MKLDVSAACPLDGRFVLEYLEWESPPEMRLTMRHVFRYCYSKKMW